LSSLPNLDYTSVDLESPLAMHKMDLAQLAFEDERFGVVICSHVLEHIPDDRRAMRELYRVLRPGGWGIIQSPVDVTREATLEDETVVSPRQRERLFEQRDHVRSYWRDYFARLEEAGFVVASDPYVDELDVDEGTVGLPRGARICVCTKRNVRCS
jgi:SAM-dependent methyltransferase